MFCACVCTFTNTVEYSLYKSSMQFLKQLTIYHHVLVRHFFFKAKFSYGFHSRVLTSIISFHSVMNVTNYAKMATATSAPPEPVPDDFHGLVILL